MAAGSRQRAELLGPTAALYKSRRFPRAASLLAHVVGGEGLIQRGSRSPLTWPSAGRGGAARLPEPGRRGAQDNPRPAAVGGPTAAGGSSRGRLGAPRGMARRRAAPPTAEGSPSAGCRELHGVHGWPVPPLFPSPPPHPSPHVTG